MTKVNMSLRLAQAKEQLAKTYLSRIDDDPGNGDWRRNTNKLVADLRQQAAELRRRAGS